jgi:ketosteroid isomerase-like protein
VDADRVALLRRFYDAWNRDDFDALSALLHPDIEWRSSGVFPGLEPVYRGQRQVRQWWDAVHEPFEEFTIRLDEVREVEGELAACVRFRAVGRESGAPVDLPFVHVVTFEDGLIRRISSHVSVEKALAAVRDPGRP